jgi:hypothetical protein
VSLEDRADLLMEADLVSSGILSGCESRESNGDPRPQESETTRAEHEQDLGKSITNSAGRNDLPTAQGI